MAESLSFMASQTAIKKQFVAGHYNATQVSLDRKIGTDRATCIITLRVLSTIDPS
jgi:hypothetical protein